MTAKTDTFTIPDEQREAATVLYRSTLALHGLPPMDAVCTGVVFTARTAEGVGVSRGDFLRACGEEYDRAKQSRKDEDRALRDQIDAVVKEVIP